MKLFHLIRTTGFLLLLLYSLSSVRSQDLPAAGLFNVAPGWASNTVNTSIFRKNSLVTFRDTQFVAFYDPQGTVVLGKRLLASPDWILEKTPFRGHVQDAHNVISIMVDGEGYLHLAWDHHNNRLHYSKSLAPGSLKMGEEQAMTGLNEKEVSYPEFYKLPNGNLLFFYRDGGSGRGNLVLNRYDIRSRTWKRLHDNLISGEGKRNAYWQAYVDATGIVHVSWVWRESPDVASNHDMAYAHSLNGGLTWENSTGGVYSLPITAASAEYARRIPQGSELMNQTSMAADEKGRPFIASYWTDPQSGFPQYHILYHTGRRWETRVLNFRTSGFSLSGMGTKGLPISRPQIMVQGAGRRASLLMLFRDEERDNRASVLLLSRLGKKKWQISDMNSFSLGSWEPTYDTELWKERKRLSVFIQHTIQIDGEGLADAEPQPVMVLDWHSPYFAP